MALSGKGGTVIVGMKALLEVTKWMFDPQCGVPKYNSNTTAGYKTGVAGVFDGKGTIEVKFDQTDGVDLVPGQVVTLLLYAASTTHYYTVPAIISGAPVECDIDGGEIVSITYAFEATGAWTENGGFA